MKVDLKVTLDLDLLDGPEPQPGTLHAQEMAACARIAVDRALLHFQGEGFLHPLQNEMSIMVDAVEFLLTKK